MEGSIVGFLLILFAIFMWRVADDPLPSEEYGADDQE